MKADWSKAPEWANHYAVDCDGEAWWFEFDPVYYVNEGVWVRGDKKGRAARVGYDEMYIESRPGYGGTLS